MPNKRVNSLCMMQVMVLAGIVGVALSRTAKAEPPTTTCCGISPDGKLLAFDIPKSNGRDGPAASIVVSSLDGSDSHEIKTIPGYCTGLAWLGNDRLACAIVESDARYKEAMWSQNSSPAWPGAGNLIKVISLDGFEIREIRLPPGCDILYKAFSPDVKYVTFVGGYRPANQQARHGLFVIKLEDGSVRQLLDQAVKTVPAWSPNSKKLTIGNGAGYVQRYPLVVIDVESGAITPTASEGVGIAWSPDGQRLACTTEVIAGGSWMRGVPIDGRIGVFDIQNKAMKLLTPPGHNTHQAHLWQVGGSFNPVWSSDGKWIAYWRTASITLKSATKQLQETWVVNCEGTEFRKVSEGWQQVGWSPDSKWLIWIKNGKPERLEFARLPLVDAVAEYARRPTLDPDAIAAAAHANYSAAQAIGKPNTPSAGDMPTAWASATPDGQSEWLLLEYSQPIKAKEVHVVETFNPGALVRVTAFDSQGKEVEAWKGQDPTSQGSRMSTSKIPIHLNFPISKIKLYIDSPCISGWNEIDAVGLLDEAGKLHWAQSAQASSTYGEERIGNEEGETPILSPEVPIPDNAVRLSYVADLDMRSLGGSGHAIAFERPATAEAIMSISIYASRYGDPQPPKENFHIYLLDQNQKVIKDMPFPYASIARGKMRWYTFPVSQTDVPSHFFVALSFNPHQTKGIYLGLDRNVSASHSYIGLPASGFTKVEEKYDWMVRVYLVPKDATKTK